MLGKSLCASFCGGLCLVSAAFGQGISAIGVTDYSGQQTVVGGSQFTTQSSVGAVEQAGNAYSFTHRMAFLNAYTSPGTVAQLHRGVVEYDLAFTIEDPANVGFSVNIDALARGISSITQNTALGSTAFATGLNCLPQYDDSTDAPDTFSNINGLLLYGTGGVSVIGPGSLTELQTDSESASLGSYIGTTSFVLRFSSYFTPTTNVVFQNNEQGSGYVNYGLLPPPGNIAVDQVELGDFITVTAVYAPEPSTLAVIGAGVMLLLRRRALRKV